MNINPYVLYSVLFLTMLSLGNCQSKNIEPHEVNFSINLDTWIEDNPLAVQSIDHYGVIVIDVIAKKRVLEMNQVTREQGQDINFPLEKHRPYYILLIAYDDENKVLNYTEKEFSI